MGSDLLKIVEEITNGAHFPQDIYILFKPITERSNLQIR